MKMRHLLLLLCLLLHTEAFNYDPLTILLACPARIPPLPRKIEAGLFEAVNDLAIKISVSKEPIRFLDSPTLGKCVQNEESRLRVVDSLTGRSDEVIVSQGIQMFGYNYLLIVETNAKICREQNLLATAKPCEPVEGHRPMIGLLNICEGPRWDNFHSVKDLFRHEILHALGFGTFMPNAYGMSPPSEGYTWFDGTRDQKAIRHFLDFSHEALTVARQHFNCPSLRGIEADSVDKIHLNEYMYGNELMTPRVSNGQNPFSYISATILENTYTDNVRWYSVNRTALAVENAQYWYGRGWGCDFVQDSCHRLQNWPFCSKESLRKGSVTYCVKDQFGMVRKFGSSCMTSQFGRFAPADNGIQASPLTYSPMSGRMGEPKLFRFCPIAEDVYHNKIGVSPGDIVFTC